MSVYVPNYDTENYYPFYKREYIIADCIKFIFSNLKYIQRPDISTNCVHFCISSSNLCDAIPELIRRYKREFIQSRYREDAKKNKDLYKSEEAGWDYSDLIVLIAFCYCKKKPHNILLDFEKLVNERISFFISQPPYQAYNSKLSTIQKTFSLTDLEIKIIRCQMAVIYEPLFPSEDQIMHSKKTKTIDSHIDTLQMLLHTENTQIRTQIRKLLLPNRPLRRFGLICDQMNLSNTLLEYFDDMTDSMSFKSIFFNQIKLDEAHSIEKFAHLTEQTKILSSLIKAHQFDRPLNILFYGHPGTGKTSFAASIAAHLKMLLFSIPAYEHAQMEAETYAEIRNFREIGIQVSETLLPSHDAIIMIDECDHLLITNDYENHFSNSSTYFGTDQKHLINETLDMGKNIRIWITNNTNRIDLSTKRRFDYSIEFPTLNRQQREMLWLEVFKQHTITPNNSQEIIKKLAAAYELNTGSMDTIVKNYIKMVPLQEGQTREFNHDLAYPLIQSHIRLLSGSHLQSDTNRICRQYSLESLNIKGEFSADDCLTAIQNFYSIQKQSITLDNRPVSAVNLNFLFQGPPGTGKTEFVKYVAQYLDIPLTIKCGSDLISKWLGESEKNIANMFKSANSHQSILFIDEADSLFQKRQNAVRSWEISTVSELLIQMERFNGVLICATNFLENLDEAVMRRFALKLEFDYLDPESQVKLFQNYFQDLLSEEPDTQMINELSEIPHLTHGDFKVVRQKYFYLGVKIHPQQLINDLSGETDFKKDFKRKKVGFR